ncbi:uncharacterized protein LOC124458086 [Xenia sp. Carnegie-2017]|uniref:uncharacterized protein LOC124458086 n=1 Tax=Xenia sp. Carnegie-2017 TaxID=2897299 RepID=UPI001F041F94|nr:uncharacterized protein LOC124458086 [Xenia sp. Carnegie-2017]
MSRKIWLVLMTLLGVDLLSKQIIVYLNTKFVSSTNNKLLKANKQLMSCLGALNNYLNASGKTRRLQQNQNIDFPFLRSVNQPNNEKEVSPFDSFDNSRVFAVNQEGLNAKPSRTLVGSRNVEHEQLLKFAVEMINYNIEGSEIKAQDLVNGISGLDRVSDNESSKSIALEKGVHSWENGNDIMFFCDVDMYFDTAFLDRCRFYTEPGKMVYFPIVFSLYNPILIHGGSVKNIKESLRHNENHGYWRTYGFGMVCFYKNDFKGMDLSIRGWGGEDVKHFRRYLNDKTLAVIRVPDRGIFHLYHPKSCDPTLSNRQLRACLQVKARSEGSKAQMSKLAFGNFIYGKDQMDWKIELNNIFKTGKSVNKWLIETSAMEKSTNRFEAFIKTFILEKQKNTSYDNLLEKLQKTLGNVSNLLQEITRSNLTQI